MWLLCKRDRLFEVRRFYGMEMNVVKTKVTRVSRQQSPVHIMMDQKQLDDVEYFNFVGSILTNDARCTREMNSSIAMAKAIFKKKTLFASKLELKFEEETSKVLHVE
jgi:hypothetical protein